MRTFSEAITAPKLGSSTQLHLVDTRFQTRKPEVSALVRLSREIRCDERRAVNPGLLVVTTASHDRFPDRIYDPAGEVSSQALGFSTFWDHYC